MSEQELTTQNRTGLRAAADAEQPLRPAVDVYEDENGITLYADLPGVTSEQLNLEVDKDNLLIEGTISLDVPDTMEAAYADIRATRYRRSFSLSNELQPDKVEAQLKDGTLTLRIPKREEVRPRKIEVRAG